MQIAWFKRGSLLEWGLLLLVLTTAVALRFWQLGYWPAGLYRDEAFNGLDALQILDGKHALFFAANNGREPAYIYLTALAVTLFGQTIFAVRLAAAVVGALTTIPVYLLGKSWFSWRVGLLAAAVWAITLWPLHLSHIGLRPILLVPLLALAFWVGTLAYRRQKAWLWVASGLLYGATFYTYLAARFTPLLLMTLLVYMILTQRGKRLWPGAAWFVLGTAVAILPFLILILQHPEMFLGRTGQVSILHPDVNHGDLWGTLWQQITAAFGMFIWRGDNILRHNPSGRPVFDIFMLIPFMIGLGWCLKHWRQAAAMTVLLWTVIMLGPTILAADAPHFLRAVGVLPAVIFLPALGLTWLWQWPRLPHLLRPLLVTILLLSSLGLTIHDYSKYNRDPETMYLFEGAATELANEINAADSQTAVYLDKSIWTSWPSIEFLVTDPDSIQRYEAQTFLSSLSKPATIFTWPYASLDFLQQIITPPAQVTITNGPLTHGDLESEAYPLYVQYAIQAPQAATLNEPLAVFENGLQLLDADISLNHKKGLKVTLTWAAETDPSTSLSTSVAPTISAFVHISSPDGLIGQFDAPAAQGRWSNAWWQPDISVTETRLIQLDEPFDAARHELLVGLYDTQTGKRLSILEANGALSATTAVAIEPE